MAIDYDALAATARRLIAQSGRQVVMRNTRTTPSDPAKPWRGNADPDVGGAGLDPVTVDAVAVPPSSAASLGMSTSAPELLQRASRVFIVAPPEADEDIAGRDELVDGDATLRVTHVEELRPANTTLLYYVMVEG